MESRTWHHKADEAIRQKLRLWADWEADTELTSLTECADRWRVSSQSQATCHTVSFTAPDSLHLSAFSCDCNRSTSASPICFHIFMVLRHEFLVDRTDIYRYFGYDWGARSASGHHSASAYAALGLQREELTSERHTNSALSPSLSTFAVPDDVSDVHRVLPGRLPRKLQWLRQKHAKTASQPQAVGQPLTVSQPSTVNQPPPVGQSAVSQPQPDIAISLGPILQPRISVPISVPHRLSISLSGIVLACTGFPQPNLIGCLHKLLLLTDTPIASQGCLYHAI